MSSPEEKRLAVSWQSDANALSMQGESADNALSCPHPGVEGILWSLGGMHSIEREGDGRDVPGIVSYQKTYFCNIILAFLDLVGGCFLNVGRNCAARPVTRRAVSLKLAKAGCPV